MKRRKSIRETKAMVQTALWLPRDMHEQLKQAGGERGLGDEIRRRLQRTFDDEKREGDPVTDLLADLTRQVDLRFRDVGRWYEDPWICNKFKDALGELASSLCLVRSQSVSAPEPATLSKLHAKYGPDVKPESIGTLIARAALVENATEQLRLRSAGERKG